MDERPGRGGLMTASPIATAAALALALAIGLPIFALGERVRERAERRLTRQPTSPTQKDLS